MAPGAPIAPRGPQPTKPVIKPMRKMKALHWTRLLLPPGAADSIWQAVDKIAPKVAPKVPAEEIDGLFADVKAPKAGDASAAAAAAADGSSVSASASPSSSSVSGSAAPSSSAVDSSKRENVRVLSDKRFNAVAIMLSFLPPIDGVIRAVQRLDLSLLDKDQVAALHKQMPSEEELKALTSADCKPDELAKPEAFLLALTRAIPAVNSRIDCWNFSLNFKEVAADLRTPFTFIQSAISAVRQSKTLPLLCAVVLHAGNYINGSTNRGCADGFDLAVLGRLAMFKSGDGSTMLTWVVNKLLDIEGPEFGNAMAAELAPCRGASEFPLRPALAASTRFQGVIKIQKNLAALVQAQSDDSTDAFTSYMGAFGKEAESVGSELRALGAHTNEQFGMLLYYLNPCLDAATAAKTNSEELFSTLTGLAAAVKEVADERKAAMAAKAAQKKQQEIFDRQKAVKAKAAAEKAEKVAAAEAAKKA